MSLIQKQSMTDKNRAAHQRNGRQSGGAATAEGQERNRAAHLKHGFYSRQREEALRALGEDPAELAALIESAHEDWRPANAFQARIAERLARLLWRMERAERIQESLATQPVERHEKHRQAVAEALRRETMPQVDILYTLREDAADARYYTPRSFFRDFCGAFGKRVQKGTEKEVLLLMHRLRKPPDLAAEPDTKTGAEPGKASAGTAKVAAGPAAGLSPPVGPSSARSERTLEPGEGRCPGVAGPNGAWPECRKVEGEDPSPDLLGGPSSARSGRTLEPGGARPGGTPVAGSEQESPEGGAVTDGPAEGGVEAAAEPAEDDYLSEMADCDDDDFPVPWPTIPVAEGRERDDLRWELVDKANSLLKVIETALEQALEEQEAPLSRIERDGLQAMPHRHAELMRREEESCFRQFVRLGNLLMKLQNHAAQREENEGSSGYVDENTGWEAQEPVTDDPEPVADSREDAGQEDRRAESWAEAEAPESETEAAESDVRSPGSEVGSERPSELREVIGRQTTPRTEPEVRARASEVRSSGAGVASESASEVRQASTHGRMLDPKLRIPDNFSRRLPASNRVPADVHL